MPATTNDVIEVAVFGDIDDAEDVINVYQFRRDSVGSVSDADILDGLIDFFEAVYTIAKALHTALVVWRGVRVRNLTTGTLIGEANFATPIEGTASGQMAPYQAAALISFKTNVPRVVMRKYFPLAEAAVGATSRLDAAVATTMDNLAAAILGQHTMAPAGNWTFGYLSPKVGGFIAPTTSVISAPVATQRRRRPGVGS